MPVASRFRESCPRECCSSSFEVLYVVCAKRELAKTHSNLPFFLRLVFSSQVAPGGNLRYPVAFVLLASIVQIAATLLFIIFGAPSSADAPSFWSFLLLIPLTYACGLLLLNTSQRCVHRLFRHRFYAGSISLFAALVAGVYVMLSVGAPTLVWATLLLSIQHAIAPQLATVLSQLSPRKYREQHKTQRLDLLIDYLAGRRRDASPFVMGDPHDSLITHAQSTKQQRGRSSSSSSKGEEVVSDEAVYDVVAIQEATSMWYSDRHTNYLIREGAR